MAQCTKMGTSATWPVACHLLSCRCSVLEWRDLTDELQINYIRCLARLRVTTLSPTIFHTQLCRTPFLTQLCRPPSHTTLSPTIFHTRLSHTQLTQLCHPPSFTHNFVTHHLSHTTLSAQLCVAGVALGDLQLRFAWQARGFSARSQLSAKSLRRSALCALCLPADLPQMLPTTTFAAL